MLKYPLGINSHVSKPPYGQLLRQSTPPPCRPSPSLNQNIFMVVVHTYRTRSYLTYLLYGGTIVLYCIYTTSWSHKTRKTNSGGDNHQDRRAYHAAFGNHELFPHYPDPIFIAGFVSCLLNVVVFHQANAIPADLPIIFAVVQVNCAVHEPI